MGEVLFFILFFALFAIITLQGGKRHRRRRNSLRKEPDGSYVWIDMDGRPRKSRNDPSAPGGEWDTDGSSSYGFGDAGDGGGGGGD